MATLTKIATGESYNGVKNPAPAKSGKYTLTKMTPQVTGTPAAAPQQTGTVSPSLATERADERDKMLTPSASRQAKYGLGNIDLTNRPIYKNDDGSISTVRSMSFGEDGKEILVPTIAFDKNGNPTLLTDQQAIDRYHQTGEFLGKFDTIEQANKYAQDLHKQQENYYSPKSAPNTPVAKGSFTGNRQTAPTATQRLVNILAGAAKSTGSGVVNALGVASDVSDSYEAAKKNMGVTTHADAERATMQMPAASGQRSTAELYDTADRLQQQSAQSIGTAKQGLGKVGSTLVDVGVAGTQMLGDAAVNLVAPGAGLAAMGTRAFGNAAQEARQKGATLAQQLGYGAAVGGVEVLTEKMFNGLAGLYGKGAADEVVESVIKKLAKTGGGQNALRVLSSAAGEGIEEFVAGVTEPALQAIFDKQSVASHYDKSTMTDALHDTIVGAILGGVGGGFSVARSGAAQMAQNAAPNGVGARTDVPEDNLTAHMQSAVQRAQSGVQSGVQRAQSGAQRAPYVSVYDALSDGRRVAAADIGSKADVWTLDAALELGTVDMDAEGKLFRVNADEHIDRRDYGNVSSRKLNAFQFDHPGLHDYYVKAAQALSDDLANAEKGGQIVEIPPAFDEPGLNSTYIRTKRSATPEVAELLDDASLSYDEIAKALDAIIQNHGQENYAAAKKVEVMLDRMLTNGYTTSYGEVVSPNAQYVEDKTTYVGAVQQTQGDALADVDALPTERNDGLGGADAGTLNSGFQNMQAQSDEFHPINESAAQREVESLGRAPEEVPTVNPFTGRDIGKTVSTILNSEITSNEMIPVLEQAVANGQFDYIPVTDKGAMARAQQTMQKLGGWQSAATNFIAKAQFGRTAKHDFALGVACYNEAVAAGDTATAFQLADAIGEVAHTSAQTVQAVNLFNRLTPAGKLLTLKNHLRRLNAKRASTEKTGKAKEYADKLDALEAGRPDLALDLDADLAAAYLMAETDEARAQAWQDIINDIASKMPPTAMEKWNYWRYTAMLTNPVTHVRNTVGNTVQDGLRRVKNAVGIVMERAIPQEQRTKARLTNSEADTALKNYARALYEQDKNAAMGTGKYSETSASGIAREIQDARKMFGEKYAVGKAVQKVGDVNTAALEAEDVIFNRGAYVDSLAQALKARGITYEMAVDGQHDAAVNEARAYAIREAARATYRDSNAFSDFVSNLGKTGYKPADALVDALLPFRRTPANILVRGTVDYSPLALGKAFAQVRSGADAADVVDTLASGLTGTGVLALGAYLTAEGLLHIKAGGDDREEDFLKASGYQDFSVQIGDTSYTLDWLVPAAMPLFAGSAMMNGWEQNGGAFADFLSAMGSISDVILETSMLQSINNMIENMSYADSKAWFILSSALTSYLSQAVPTVGGKVASALDDTARKAYTQGGKSDVETDASYFAQSVARKIPGAREQLQPSIDLWGREISNGGAAERFAEAFVSPGFFSTADTSAVTQELQRLAGTQGSTVYPSKAARSFKVGGETKYLTAEEYTEFAKNVGKTRYDALGKITRDSRYKAMSDADKAEVVSNVYEYANAKAKSEISDYEPTSWVQKAMGSGNAADYILTRKQESDAAAAAKEEKAAAWEKTLTSLKPYGVTQKVLDSADKNGGGVNQAEMAAYLATRSDLDAAAKQMIWNSVGGWKTSYADYAKKHK